jgi:hypothetical protein
MASNRKKTSTPVKRGSTGPAGVPTAARHDEQELDACDFRLDETEATPDEDLPAAEGGVA